MGEELGELGGGGGGTVVGGVVVAKDDVTLDAVLVLDEEVRQGGGIWDELTGSSASGFYMRYEKGNTHWIYIK